MKPFPAPRFLPSAGVYPQPGCFAHPRTFVSGAIPALPGQLMISAGLLRESAGWPQKCTCDFGGLEFNSCTTLQAGSVLSKSLTPELLSPKIGPHCGRLDSQLELQRMKDGHAIWILGLPVPRYIWIKPWLIATLARLHTFYDVQWICC